VNRIVELRQTGESAVDQWKFSLRSQAQQRIRRSLGVRGDPPAPCMDEELAYLPLNGAARYLHGDLSSMLVGGVASLLLQMLHPLAMTAVAEHSRYREDPLGRLQRTASFIGTTTYGSRADALASIRRVRSVHASVHGVMSDGTKYRADDPHLLEWVHLCELSMFIAGVSAYGPQRLNQPLLDQYVEEMAEVARELGVSHPPTTVEMMNTRLQTFRGELELIDVGREARDFVVRGVATKSRERVVYAAVVAAAVGVLPKWARRQLELPHIAGVNTLIVRPGATALLATLRLAVPPTRV
jgi:uncharacterized protein (DUF2236 family)